MGGNLYCSAQRTVLDSVSSFRVYPPCLLQHFSLILNIQVSAWRIKVLGSTGSYNSDVMGYGLLLIIC